MQQVGSFTHADDGTAAASSSSSSSAKPRPSKRHRVSTNPKNKSSSSKAPRKKAQPIRNRQSAPQSFRRTPKQVVQQAAADRKQQAKYDEAVADATSIYEQEKKKPGGLSSAAVSEKMKKDRNVMVPASTIRDRVAKGKAGQPNDARGPKGKIEPIFHLLCELVATKIALVQSNNQPDLTAPAIKQLLRELLAGSAQGTMNIDALYRRIRAEIAPVVSAGKVAQCELRRQLWTSDTNLNVWFDSFKSFCCDMGFAKDEPETGPDGTVVSEITFLPDQKHRIINLDESRITTDGTAGSPGGRPAHCLAVKNIPSTGTAVNKSGDGGTIICGSNAAGEPMPPHIQFSTDASSPEKYPDECRVGRRHAKGICPVRMRGAAVVCDDIQ
mmetsp:Transcript_34998/g.75824  ORF Transcript_34998/g.75824 Transcript_34998/m.75824 type:complete len:384 (+) Transcript_34998:1894-3045(+)